MRVIYRRELKAYFNSMIAPLFIAVTVLLMGIYFMYYNMRYGYPYFSYTLSAVINIFIFTIPVLTMRSMSEERRQKTDQLLLTAPVTVTQVVLGKYLSMMTVVAVPCLIFCLCPLIIASTGTAYLLVDYSCILVFFLLGGVFVAVGMLISSLTESVILAAVGTMGSVFLIMLMPSIASFIPSTSIASFLGCIILLTAVAVLFYVVGKNWVLSAGLELAGLAVMAVLYLVWPELYENCIPNLLQAIAVSEIYYTFSEDYIFDLAGIFKMLSVIAVCLFLTGQTVQKRRWS